MRRKYLQENETSPDDYDATLKFTAVADDAHACTSAAATLISASGTSVTATAATTAIFYLSIYLFFLPSLW